MRKTTQEEQMNSLLKRPIPKKKVGIVHLQMVKESRVLYGMKRFTEPSEGVEMVRPLFEKAAREMVLVLSLNTKLEPQAAEVVAVGGISQCFVDIRDLFKHAILNGASFIVCFHNHPSGYPEPSREDRQLTRNIQEAGKILGVPLIDHIILGEDDFFSFREHGEIVSTLPDDAA